MYIRVHSCSVKHLASYNSAGVMRSVIQYISAILIAAVVIGSCCWNSIPKVLGKSHIY